MYCTIDQQIEAERLAKAIEALTPLGWDWKSEWLFRKGKHLYDLSAANLTKLEYIESEGLFVVAS